MPLTKAPVSPPNAVKAPTSDVPREILRDQWGRPLIVQPDGSVKGYTRASSLGGVLEDQNGLGIWKQRAVAWGIGHSNALYLQAAAIGGIDDPADKSALGQVAKLALEKADTDAAARSGTAIHALTERRDRGEALPFLGDDQPAMDAYIRMISHFTIWGMEQFVVCDELETAGTYDRLVSPRFEIPVPELDITLSPEDRLIDDLKTSSTADYFGIKFCVQETAYRHGVPYRGWVDRDELERLGYDRDLPLDELQRLPGKVKEAISRGERLPWPDGISPRKDVGLIMHVPSGGSTAQLHAVDLTAGWELAKLAKAVQAWRGRKDLVVPVQLDLITAAIEAATTREQCRAIWEGQKDVWTAEHTAAVQARLAEIEDVA